MAIKPSVPLITMTLIVSILTDESASRLVESEVVVETTSTAVISLHQRGLRMIKAEIISSFNGLSSPSWIVIYRLEMIEVLRSARTEFRPPAGHQG